MLHIFTITIIMNTLKWSWASRESTPWLYFTTFHVFVNCEVLWCSELKMHLRWDTCAGGQCAERVLWTGRRDAFGRKDQPLTSRIQRGWPSGVSSVPRLGAEKVLWWFLPRLLCIPKIKCHLSCLVLRPVHKSFLKQSISERVNFECKSLSYPSCY